MKRAFLALACLFAAGTYLATLQQAGREGMQLQRPEEASLEIPSAFIRVSSLEFDGLVSDLLFIKTMMFLAKTGERKVQINEAEWGWVAGTLTTITDLDPYFLDPYYFANAYLTGTPEHVRKTNALLEKGSRARSWDWMLPFFIGFNHFYYLHDDAKAAEYLMEAARRPGPSEMLAGLAAKLAFHERRTENLISFLEEMRKGAVDEGQRRNYETRLNFLYSLRGMENAVAIFKQRFGRPPRQIDELVKKGIMGIIPKDPLGGSFYLDGSGIVHSTSEGFVLPPPPK